MTRDVYQGLTGTDVRIVQRALNFQIRRLAPIKEDGNFGSATKARVIEFQKANPPLKADGIVGPRTRGFLFELTPIATQVLYVPLLTRPTFGAAAGNNDQRFGIQPPRLIPPLTLPSANLDPPVIAGQSFFIPDPFGKVVLNDFKQPAIANMLTMVPTRNDPLDPFQQTRKELVRVVNSIPVNSKFRASILGLIPTPSNPDPMKRPVSFPGTGFNWDVDFLGIISPMNPNTITLAGNASIWATIVGEPKGTNFLLQLGAWGDVKAELNYGSQQGRSGFTAGVTYNSFLGARGVF